MIYRITGISVYAGERFTVIQTHGVGYKISCTHEVLERVKKEGSKEISLWTHHVVREDADDLYGFLEHDALIFFELLITISGIGPKTALGILNVTAIQNIRRAIASGDTSHLTKISGIGKKIADKIVLELNGKIESIEGDDAPDNRAETDALEGLKALGYGEREAREALKTIPKEILSPGARIKQALKILGK